MPTISIAAMLLVDCRLLLLWRGNETRSQYQLATDSWNGMHLVCMSTTKGMHTPFSHSWRVWSQNQTNATFRPDLANVVQSQTVWSAC